MRQVVALRPRRGGEVQVRLDDGRTLLVPAEAWERVGVDVPGPVEPQVLRELERQGQLRRLRRRALRLLSLRARSARELANRLRRDADDQMVGQVLAELQQAGLVDDARFALEWVQARRESRGLGEARLRHELLKKGVARELVHKALERASRDEESLAVQVARRRVAAYAGQAPEVAARRLAAYLARRGFGPAVVAKALRAVGLGRVPSPEGEEAL